MKRIRFVFKLFFVLVFILFEEVAWNKIARPIFVKFQSLRIVRRFKHFLLAQKNRYVLLLIFIIPFALTEVFTIVSVHYFATGHFIFGVFLYISQIFLTIPVVFIFTLAKKPLLSFYIIKQTFYYVIWFKRTKMFRGTMRFIEMIKEQFSLIKAQYLDKDTDTNLKTSFLSLYKAVKSYRF